MYLYVFNSYQPGVSVRNNPLSSVLLPCIGVVVRLALRMRGPAELIRRNKYAD